MQIRPLPQPCCLDCTNPKSPRYGRSFLLQGARLRGNGLNFCRTGGPTFSGEPMSALVDLRPRLVLVCSDATFSLAVRRFFAQNGWNVTLAKSCEELRSVTSSVPQLVLIDADLPDQSGFLTCAKLLQACPDLHVYIFGTGSAPTAHRFSNFVGAAGYVDRSEGMVSVFTDLATRFASSAGRISSSSLRSVSRGFGCR